MGRPPIVLLAALAAIASSIVVTTTDAAYAMIVRDKADTAIARFGPDGTLAWVSTF